MSHTYAHSHIQIHTNSQTHKYTNTSSQIQTHTYTQKLTQTHTNSEIYTQKHADTHIYTNSQTHNPQRLAYHAPCPQLTTQQTQKALGREGQGEGGTAEMQDSSTSAHYIVCLTHVATTKQPSKWGEGWRDGC